jgi:immune inhibitor A
MRAAVTAVAMLLLAAGAADAQEAGRRAQRELRGFDFTPDGVWRVKARRVRLERERLLARGDFARLNAPMALRAAQPAATAAVSGVLPAPALLFGFRDTDPASRRDTSQYTQTLFAALPPVGRPYTLRTFYEEMSGGQFNLQGRAVGWVTLDSNESRYVGPASGCTPYGTCNGVWSGAAFSALQAGLREAVAKADPLVDFGQYDNDGPDGIPNSADDDGAVDIVLFVHAAPDGACRSIPNNNHPWSHRASLGVTTADPRPPQFPGQFIRVTNYILQSGLGGATNCDITQIMGIGTAAHELGHGLGLPDFYDTNEFDSDDSEGIGQWGLMGSGNYTSATSPSYMESFSRSQLGWITIRPVTQDGVYTLGPSTSGDTAILVRPRVANPRGEYFLLENRQPVLSDTAMMRFMGPGLLIWHFDSTQYARGSQVNSGAIHGLWLRQADGLNQLRSSVSGVRNRGDAGDPFPGSTGNRQFTLGTNPSATLNATGGYTGFTVDSIRQVVPGGEMAFLLRVGPLTVVTASDTLAEVRIRGSPYRVYRDWFVPGDTVTISVDSAQSGADGRRRFAFTGWSDGGARTHTVTTTANDAVVTALMTRSFRLQVAVNGLPGSPLARDTFLAEDDSVALDAAAPPLTLFAGWTGDTAAVAPRLVLPMQRPYSVTATFRPLALDSVVAQLTIGTGLDLITQAILDGQGNRNGRFDVGDFVAWLDGSGTVVSAVTMARLLGRAR